MLASAEFPAASAAVTWNVSVPSARPLTSMPVMDQVPSPATVAWYSLVEFVPSVTIRVIVAPTSPVPLASWRRRWLR